MKSKVQSRIVLLSYFISAIGSLALNYLKVNNMEFYGLVGAIKVSSLLTIWWFFYFKLGWKIPILNRILYKININGTWFGKYKSVSSDKKTPNVGDIVLRINQDFLSLSIISYTENYKNYSYSEELRYEEKSDTYDLVYVYSQKENSPFDFNARNGTSDLKVLKYEDTYKLEGDFWTIFGSKGNLNVVKVSDQIVDSFMDGRKLWEQSKYKQKENSK